MYRKLVIGFGLLLAGALVLPLPVAAQSNDASEMSAEELETLFQKQKTRGLVLAPTNQEDAAANTADTAPEAQDSTYVEFAPEDQVNIQISFDFDSAALRDDQKPKLATLCQVMKSADIGTFRIIGHTDASGSASYNERLSLLRAEEVKRYLSGDCGIEEQRLEAVGVGEQFPLDKADPRGDANRRVEFQALS
ncbi:OmpA/MotB domain protein [Pseudooceanicola batsensis HTCC2597]|uniref:OmpA/MotB domain protein n=1 Tax=Pseudooceanicola batsensis (strain ATCC BAA-863 / DSM 15984 / KCTC 12145 / HTCC2597) TaxID=252305 RepID=A3TYD3_PSEBH|nr:OmpA family protein [Pseudooceanicola batsensis]EAQ03167.1 OmpA/MotB domain protein [Pseudooceanicola batsensis HTCC2597]